MKRIDLDINRKRLVTIKSGDKEFEVRQPTLRQLLEHEQARVDAVAEAQQLREEGKYGEATKIQMEFFVDEVLIFVPQLKREHVLDMTENQRIKIMKEVRPELYVDEGERGEAITEDPQVERSSEEESPG